MLHSGGQEFAQSCKEWALALRGKSWPGMRCCTLPAQGFPFYTLPRESGSIMFRITVRGKSWRSLEALALALQGKGWPGMCCSAKPRTAVACMRAGTKVPFFFASTPRLGYPPAAAHNAPALLLLHASVPTARCSACTDMSDFAPDARLVAYSCSMQDVFAPDACPSLLLAAARVAHHAQGDLLPVPEIFHDSHALLQDRAQGRRADRLAHACT